MDTSSLSFTGAGGETLGQRGHSKNRRPDLSQMIVAFVVDGDGRPICSKMWPGNTADVSVLVRVINRLQARFGIQRACMIAAQTIRALEQRELEYILGVRDRSEKVVGQVVLQGTQPFTPLLIERSAGETQLFANEVRVDGKRYIVCRNEAEATKDRADREAVVAGLEAQLMRGDKALIGNSAYRRYLRATDRRNRTVRRHQSPGNAGGARRMVPRRHEAPDSLRYLNALAIFGVQVGPIAERLRADVVLVATIIPALTTLLPSTDVFATKLTSPVESC